MWLEKARESLRAAESRFALELSNSCATRCDYAMFQVAAVALEATGFHRDAWSHAALHATFTNGLIHRRKIYPRPLAEYLNRALFWRNMADYAEAEISQRRAKQLVAWARTVVATVEEVIGHGIG